ncbi:MAG: putative lipid II flippase FtsW [Tissierellia bacterium]|jgi:cell division protein FtsW|nr:putative lipid II flippase FtsW [Bacillota bacterium]NLK58783.1 putative lipid II flippase FtsW [Tissierellia bacterium]
MKGFRTKSDLRLLLLTLILCVIGLVMVFSASFPYSLRLHDVSYEIFLKQLLFFGIGFVLMILVSNIPLRFYRKHAYLLLLVALFLSGLVFTPLGTNLGTFSRRWIDLRFTTLMPSDIIKGASILAMARFIAGNRRPQSFRHGTLPAFVLIALCCIPVMLQPDTSTTFIIGAVLFALYAVFAMNLRHLLPGIGVVTGLLALYIGADPYRWERITAMWNPLKDYYGSGWQLAQSLFAVASGGVFGRGLAKSVQKFSNLSEAHNDFIFAVLAEEFGFIGSMLVVILYVLLIMRILQIALNHPDRFAQVTGTGIAALIALQAMVNILVSLGLAPPTGVTLPFISYGGTSLMMFMGLIGVVLQISRKERRETTADESTD